LSLRKSLKKLGRKTAKVSAKINRVTTPIASAAAGFLYGAPGAAAVTAIGAQSGYYFRSTQARDEGITGRSARALGRGERKRVAIYGAAGGGAGMLTSGIVGLTRGASLLEAGGHTLFGQSGAQILGLSNNTVFSPVASNVSGFITPANFASQKALPVPGLVTQSQIAPSLAGGTSELAGAGTSGGSLGAKLLGTVPSLLSAYSTAKPVSSGANGSINPNTYGDLSSMLGGGGGGGDSGGGGGFMNAPTADGQSKGGLIAAILVGALLLAG
jgi:hypothetical protein